MTKQEQPLKVGLYVQPFTNRLVTSISRYKTGAPYVLEQRQQLDVVVAHYLVSAKIVKIEEIEKTVRKVRLEATNYTRRHYTPARKATKTIYVKGKGELLCKLKEDGKVLGNIVSQ